MAGIFKLTPPSAHIISTLRLNKNRVNDTAPQQSTDSNVTFQHVDWPAVILLDEGKGGAKRGKKRNGSDLSVPSPTSCFNPLSGTSYITVPLFHLERDADFKQRLRDSNHLLVESKTDCIYN